MQNINHKSKLCNFYMKGNCVKGDQCNFLHLTDMNIKNIKNYINCLLEENEKLVEDLKKYKKINIILDNDNNSKITDNSTNYKFNFYQPLNLNIGNQEPKNINIEDKNPLILNNTKIIKNQNSFILNNSNNDEFQSFQKEKINKSPTCISIKDVLNQQLEKKSITPQYTVELIDIKNKIDPKFIKFLEELEKEKNYTNNLLNDIYYCDKTKKVGNTFISEEKINVLKKRFSFFKEAKEIIHEKYKNIINNKCRYIILFRDSNDKILISMLITEKVGVSQFHLYASRSFFTTVHYILNDIPEINYLTIELHKKAMKLRDVKYIYVSCNTNTLVILQKNFHSKKLPCKMINKGGIKYNVTDFSLDFNLEDLKQIEETWPQIFNKVYCFWI